MTITLTDSIRNNRTNTKTTPIELYGGSGKQEWNALLNALYNWSVTESDKDRDAAFAAGRVIMGHFNEELEGRRKIKFEGIEDILRFRDAAVYDKNVDTEETKRLKAVKSLCLYRLGESEKCSFTGDDYQLACELVEYEPSNQEINGYFLPEAVAQEILDTVEEMLEDSAENKTARRQEKSMVGLAKFRKACENRIAEKLDGVLLKTAEQIEEERKEKNKARRAARKRAEKKNAKKEAAEKKAA